MKQYRYFETQIFVPENELSEAAAQTRGGYVRAYYHDKAPLSQPAWAEIWQGTATPALVRVVYYEQPLPHALVLRQHFHRYPGTRLEIVLPLKYTPSVTLRVAYQYNAQGVLQGSLETRYGVGIYQEWRYTATGTLSSSLEYEYNAAGEVQVVRERLGDGTLISEDCALV